MATVVGANIYIDGVKHNSTPVSLTDLEYDISNAVAEGQEFLIQASKVYDDGTESELSVVQLHRLDSWKPIDSSGNIYAWYSAHGESQRRGLIEGFTEVAEKWENETSDSLTLLKNGTDPVPNILHDGEQWIMRFQGFNGKLLVPMALFPTGNNNYTLLAKVKDRNQQDSSYILRTGNINSNSAVIFKTATDGRANTGWYSNNLFSTPGDITNGVWFNLLSKYDGAGREMRLNNSVIASDTQTNLNLQHSANLPENSIIGTQSNITVDFDVTDIIYFRGIPTESDITKIHDFLNNQPYFIARGKYEPPTDVLVTFGYGGDLHHSNTANDTTLNRYKLDAEEKLATAVNLWNGLNADFVVMNGDYVDGYNFSNGTKISNAQAITNLGVIETVFSDLINPRHYTLGNHDLESLSKTDFLTGVGQASAYYSFDVNGVHFVILDACYYADDDASHYDKGNFSFEDTYINPAQRTWLTSDLATTSNPAIIFVHQRLDAPFGSGENGNQVNPQHQIDNAAAVRSILEASGKVIGVFQGHSHENQRQTVNGITYYTMEDMTQGAYPNNAVAIVRVKNDNTIEVKGYGRQLNY